MATPPARQPFAPSSRRCALVSYAPTSRRRTGLKIEGRVDQLTGPSVYTDNRQMVPARQYVRQTPAETPRAALRATSVQTRKTNPGLLSRRELSRSLCPIHRAFAVGSRRSTESRLADPLSQRPIPARPGISRHLSNRLPRYAGRPGRRGRDPAPAREPHYSAFARDLLASGAERSMKSDPGPILHIDFEVAVATLCTPACQGERAKRAAHRPEPAVVTPNVH